jgi:anthranilate phosphoribosyltransferase
VLDGGVVSERTVAPEDFGVARTSLDALRGGDAQENAALLARILGGEAHPARAAVIVNAAAALHVVRGGDLAARAREAAGAITSGAAEKKLAAWREAAVRERSP